ncbi:unnamed protein product, partial [Phaeothamnion confervicola]
ASRCAVAFRVAFLAWIFLLPVLTAWIAWFSNSFREEAWYRLLTRSVAASGAAFIKWGQWSSTRPDIFPEGLCRALSQLHSQAPRHRYAHTEALVEAAFGGRKVSEVFDWFGKQPIASGSIAQVHKAVLAGRVVAVKVRHPHVKERMAMDFRIMRGLAEFVDNMRSLRWMNLGPSMEQFSHTLGAQTRLDVEARHLDLFNQNFRGWPDCSFPEALFQTEDVLVETYEEGFLVSEYTEQLHRRRRRRAEDAAAGAAAGGGRRGGDGGGGGGGEAIVRSLAAAGAMVRAAGHAGLEWIRLGCGRRVQDAELPPPMDPGLAHFVVSKGEDVYLKMLLVDNLMHADLHPGNILVHAPEDGSEPPRVVLVDAGMVASLVDSERENFIGLLECIGLGDGAAAGARILEFSTQQTCVDPAERRAFVDEMALLFSRCCRGYHTNVDLGVVLREALSLVRRHQVRVDVNYATLIMNVLCLDGLAKDLTPGYNLLDGAKPLLEAHWRLKGSGVGRALLTAWMPVAQSLKRRRDRCVRSRLGRGSARPA